MEHPRKDDVTITGARFEVASIVGSFTHKGIAYKTVKMGHQTWMTDNLNDDAFGGVCYDNNAINCTRDGRLYNWDEAQSINIPGWHLPTDKECGDLEVLWGMNPSERDRAFGSVTSSRGNTSLPLARTIRNATKYCFDISDTVGHQVFRSGGSSAFIHQSNDIYLWTASEDAGKGIFRAFFLSSDYIQRGREHKTNNRFSVRLVKD